MSSFDTNKFLKRMFRRINGLVWDPLSGGTGVQTENGIYTVSFDAAGVPTLNVNPLDGFGISLPAFATQKAIADVQQGDLIVGDSTIIGWAIDHTDRSVNVIDHNGHTKNYSPPTVSVMGSSGVLVVQNLINLTGSAAGAQNFAGSLLPLMLLGGDGADSKLEQMIPFLLMQAQAPAGANGAAPAANPLTAMLPFLLMSKGKGGGDIDPMMLLMMTGGLGGAGAGGLNGILPLLLLKDGGLGNLFGGSDGSIPQLRVTKPPLIRS